MMTLRQMLLVSVMVASTPALVAAYADDESLEDNTCVACHGNSDLWEGDTLHLLVTVEDLAGDIHWQKGIRCQDCHGGKSDAFDLREAHAVEDGFRKIESPADMPAFCGHCHSDAKYMEGFDKGEFQDPVAAFLQGVHGKHLQEVNDEKSATCSSCHPTHKMRAADDPLSAVHPTRWLETCGDCHVQQRTDMRKGVHHKAGERNEQGAGTVMECNLCHGDDAHAMTAVTDPASPVFLDHQVALCGDCHKDYLATYDVSVHGHGLRESGLLVTAVCADCHGAHAIYYAADRRSTLHPTKVATTCGQCHHFIEERLEKSVHGRGSGLGGVVDEAATDVQSVRHPSCTDCHQGHDLPHPESVEFRQQLSNRCGNCHGSFSSRYAMSLHGQLTDLGYGPAAKCSDCHGAHDILPVSDPQSTLAGSNRVETCRQCHPYAVSNFANFDPHADVHDAERYPGLHGVYVWSDFVIYTVLGLFALHAFLWFARSLVHTLQHGQHQILVTRGTSVVRFEPAHRITYLVLITCFLGLVLTGLPLHHSTQPWAQAWASGLGGFESTSFWHHFFAVILLSCCAVHVVWVVKKIFRLREQKVSWNTMLTGPDSPVPNARDARDLLAMVRWFFGLGEKPGFERWTYWEKFDYWALWVAALGIGTSGLMLWQPNFFARVLPGEAINVAKVIHSEVALAAASFLFVIHLFNTHFRPEKFPLDASVFTGLVDEQHLRGARPDYLERLEREGKLDEVRRVVPSRRHVWPAVLGGSLLLVLGLLILAAILLAKLSK